MSSKLKKQTEDKPIRLHLSLTDEALTDEQKVMMKRYGESLTGNSITRDILIPADMPLHNLHYAIQKLFGFQNSHLRSFHLPKDVYKKLTNNTVRGWSQLVGVLFQPPSEFERDLFWDDDYERGSIKTWLKKKYTGPYHYHGILEIYEVAQGDVEALLERFKLLRVYDSSDDHVGTLKPIINLTLKEMEEDLYLESGTDSLLERLEVRHVLAAQDEPLTDKNMFPITQNLSYHYDFGDDWTVQITKIEGIDDLLNEHALSGFEMDQATEIVKHQHKPVCLHKQGLSVLDDVGGLSGFANFLRIIYEGENKEEVKMTRAWARSLGWSDKKVANQKML